MEGVFRFHRGLIRFAMIHHVHETRSVPVDRRLLKSSHLSVSSKYEMFRYDSSRPPIHPSIPISALLPLTFFVSPRIG